MKISVLKPVEIEVAFIELILPVRYDEEDIPNDFPLRKGDLWTATVRIDTGVIENWPEGVCHELHMKVVDGGVYILRDNDRKEIARRQDYVPDIVPGSYGDYVELNIGHDGRILNWGKGEMRVADFFNED